MLQRVVSATGVVFYQSPLLGEIGVPHAFSTRVGGISPEPFASMNLGNPSGCDIQDDWDRIHENYRRLQGAAGLNDRHRCWVHQVHGGDVVFLRQGREFASGARADALISDDPDRIAAVRVADCVPVLLASETGSHVAAVHAGWRGVIAGVVCAVVREMHRAHNGRIVAAIGPCIGYDHFEVGHEVLAQFESQFGTEAPISRGPGGKGRVDLRRAVELQLLASGIPADSIDTTDRCTYRDADEFYSHRRDRGVTGRMAALISVRST